jgi:predicted ThiF/HesA family dinucleotide-utilizing enzyme
MLLRNLHAGATLVDMTFTCIDKTQWRQSSVTSVTGTFGYQQRFIKSLQIKQTTPALNQPYRYNPKHCRQGL